MKKINLFLMVGVLLSLIITPTVSAKNADELVKNSETSDVVASWNIIDVSFSTKLLTNKRTGKYVFRISPTFEYKGEEDISFQDSYIWSVNCLMSIPGDPEPTVFFENDQEFPTNAPNGVIFDNGKKMTASLRMEFDKNLAKYLRNGTPSMSCSFGFIKPRQYQYLSMGYEKGIFQTYVLTLKSNKWQVKGWNF